MFYQIINIENSSCIFSLLLRHQNLSFLVIHLILGRCYPVLGRFHTKDLSNFPNYVVYWVGIYLPMIKDIAFGTGFYKLLSENKHEIYFSVMKIPLSLEMD